MRDTAEEGPQNIGDQDHQLIDMEENEESAGDQTNTTESMRSIVMTGEAPVAGT